jgi:branched-chain amino acid transport system substrate-binding protein
MKKTLIVTLAIVLSLMMLIAGCSSGSTTPSTAPATSAPATSDAVSAEPSTAPSTEPSEAASGNAYIDQLLAPAGTPASTETGDIVIGNIQDLSGAGSVFGNSCVNGSTLAVEQINAAGGLNGRMLKLVPYDIKGDTTEAINAYTRLAEVDKAVAIAGPPLSNVGLACIEVSNKEKVPFVGAFGLPTCMVNDDGSLNPYMFLAQPSAPYIGDVIADYAMNELGFKNFGSFVRQDHSHCMGIYEEFKNYVTSHGGTITTEQFCKAGDTDFKVQLGKLQDSKPDAIVSLVTSVEDVIFVQQASQMGMTLPMVGNMDFSLPFTTLLSDPTMANNIYFPNNLDYEEAGIQGVREAYVERFGTEPDIKSYIGYDEIIIIANAIKQSGYKADAESIRNAIENNTQNVLCTQGAMSIDPANHMPTGLSMVMYKIESGEYNLLKRYQPEF